MSARRKIPVPSFAPPPPIETNDDVASEERIMLEVNEQSMIHLENALQLFLHQQKQQTDITTISFADFSRISGKIVTTSSSSNQEEDDDTEIPKDPSTQLSKFWFLSKAERFWHDLHCVAVPALYQTNSYSAETNGNSPRKRRRRFAAKPLELKPANVESKTRVKELRKRIKEAAEKGVPKSKSETAIRLLEALKQEKENNVQEPKKAKNNTSDKRAGLVDSLLQTATSAASNQASPKSTIDERIRARAKERERNLKEAKAARKDPREERVAIADALYSYASHILRRKQSRFTNKGNHQQTNKKKCVVTFDELVQKGLPNRSKKEIGRILLDITKVLTDSGSEVKFLKWKDLKTGKACGLPISKNTTVTIDTTDFKTVRETLNKVHTTLGMKITEN